MRVYLYPVCDSSARHSPLLPPLLLTSRVSVIAIDFEAACAWKAQTVNAAESACRRPRWRGAFDAAPRPHTLHMSYTVSAATLAAVMASISTPVLPRQVALATMRSSYRSGT